MMAKKQYKKSINHNITREKLLQSIIKKKIKE